MEELKSKLNHLQWKYMILALPVAFAAGFVIWKVVSGLIGMTIAASVMGLIVNLAPWASLRLANLRLSALQQEAMKRPILSMRAVLEKRKKDLEEDRESVKTFASSVRSYKRTVEALEKKNSPRASDHRNQLTLLEGQESKLLSSLSVSEQKLHLS